MTRVLPEPNLQSRYSELKLCRRSRSSQQMTERVSRPAQDILFPPTPNSTKEEEEDTKATGCYSSTDRKQQKPDIALDFLNLACFCTLSPCIIMFTSCVNVTFSKMYALFYFLPKPLYCASIISLLLLICL